VDPSDLVPTGTEREVLAAFLEDQRELIVHKVRGLATADATRPLVPSATTLAGLVKHLAGVERNWFQRKLAGRSEAEIGANASGDASTWVIGPGDTLEALVSDYRAACAESRRTAERYDLDHRVPEPRRGEVTLRWIYLHMIRETARHAGHADILREQTDGFTGDP
jgi:uncharacterized damage-inducible protein DinB